MQVSKKADLYIFQCQLIALDEDNHETEDSLKPVLVKSKTEAQQFLAQGQTVIFDGLVMSRMKAQTHSGKPEMINQNVRLNSGDVEKVNDIMRLMQHHIRNGSLDRMTQLLLKDAEKNFDDFKVAVNPYSSADETRYLIAKDLNEIEARTCEYPLIPAKEAVALFGDVNATNPLRLVTKLKKECKIIGFYFGDSRNIQIPVFQFDVVRLGVHKPVEKLCRILDGLNDWAVYKWLTTHDVDLKCTPAHAISCQDLEEDLLYLAGIFKSESKLRDLTFFAEENHNE